MFRSLPQYKFIYMYLFYQVGVDAAARNSSCCFFCVNILAQDTNHNKRYLPAFVWTYWSRIQITTSATYLPLYEYMGLMRKMPDSCSMWSSVSIRRLASLSLSMPISSILSAHWRALWFCGFNRHYLQGHIPELLPLFSVTVSASISLTFFILWGQKF